MSLQKRLHSVKIGLKNGGKRNKTRKSIKQTNIIKGGGQIIKDGIVYNGEMKDDKKHGYGTMIYDKRDIFEDIKKENTTLFIRAVYDGQWEDDKINGVGVFTIYDYFNNYTIITSNNFETIDSESGEIRIVGYGKIIIKEKNGKIMKQKGYFRIMSFFPNEKQQVIHCQIIEDSRVSSIFKRLSLTNKDSPKTFFEKYDTKDNKVQESYNKKTIKKMQYKDHLALKLENSRLAKQLKSESNPVTEFFKMTNDKRNSF